MINEKLSGWGHGMESLQSVRLDAGLLGMMLKLPSSVFLSVHEDERVEVAYAGSPKPSRIKVLGIAVLMFGVLLLLEHYTRPSEQFLVLGFGGVLMLAAYALYHRKAASTLAWRRLLFSQHELQVVELMHSGREVQFQVSRTDVQLIYPVEHPLKKKEGAPLCSLHIQAGARHIVFQEAQSMLLTDWLGHVLARWSGMRFQKLG